MKRPWGGNPTTIIPDVMTKSMDWSITWVRWLSRVKVTPPDSTCLRRFKYFRNVSVSIHPCVFLCISWWVILQVRRTVMKFILSDNYVADKYAADKWQLLSAALAEHTTVKTTFATLLYPRVLKTFGSFCRHASFMSVIKAS